jgi:hypothetical protein
MSAVASDTLMRFHRILDLFNITEISSLLSSYQCSLERRKEMILQTIPNTYLDEYKLKALLFATFGRGQFRMQVREPKPGTGGGEHTMERLSGILITLSSKQENGQSRHHEPSPM